MPEILDNTSQADGATLSPGRQRFLRYWSLNVMLMRSQGEPLIGFSYTPTELARIGALAAPVDGLATLVWLVAAAIVFILLAVAAVLGLMLPALDLLWPNAAATPAVGFFAMLAMVVLLAIGLGLPLAIVGGGAVADTVADPPVAPLPGDAALYAKVRRQFWRFSLYIALAFIVVSAVASWFGEKFHWVLTAIQAAVAIAILVPILLRAARRK